MIGYVTIGTNDLARAAKFYDALLGEVGAKPASVGNGVMVALEAESAAQVDALHGKAMKLGATDDGAPGPRGGGFYAGYFRDLDGNKLNFFFMG
jgi:predicted lactoylglutathione lyase